MRNIHLTSPSEDARFVLDALLVFWTTIIALALWWSQGPLPYFAQGLWLLSGLALGAAWAELFEWAQWLWMDSAREEKDGRC